MFNGVIHPHYGEYRSGLYFKEFPDLPMKEQGKRFRYREASFDKSMEDVIQNLAYERRQKTIITTYSLLWKSESYVLLGKNMYRIMGVHESEINEQAYAVAKVTRKEYTLTLNQVDNATGVEI